MSTVGTTLSTVTAVAPSAYGRHLYGGVASGYRRVVNDAAAHSTPSERSAQSDIEALFRDLLVQVRLES